MNNKIYLSFQNRFLKKLKCSKSSYTKILTLYLFSFLILFFLIFSIRAIAEDLHPGDLVFFIHEKINQTNKFSKAVLLSDKNRKHISHVAIILTIQPKIKLIHASKIGIAIENIDKVF